MLSNPISIRFAVDTIKELKRIARKRGQLSYRVIMREFIQDGIKREKDESSNV